MRQVIAAALDALLVFWTVAVGPLCWLLRDGLGPGAVDSHGAQAVERLLTTFAWGPVMAALLIVRLIARRRLGST